MTNSKIIILIFALIFATFNFMQAQSKFHTQIDLRYSYGLLEKGQVWNYNRSDSKMNAKSFRVTELYSLNETINIGLGIGVDKFYNPTYNTFPVFGSIQYMPFEHKSSIPYLFSNIGYGIPAEIVNPGFMSDFGLGYSLVNSKHFGLNVQLGYNYQQILVEVEIIPQPSRFTGNPIVFQNRHSLFMSLGLVF